MAAVSRTYRQGLRCGRTAGPLFLEQRHELQTASRKNGQTKKKKKTQAGRKLAGRRIGRLQRRGE